MPENDDSLIKNFEKYESFEDFKNDVRKTLEDKAREMDKVKLQNKK